MTFLVQSNVVKNYYSDSEFCRPSETVVVLRLVEADNEDDAIALFKSRVEQSEPYYSSTRCFDTEANEMIRGPL